MFFACENIYFMSDKIYSICKHFYFINDKKNSFVTKFIDILTK